MIGEVKLETVEHLDTIAHTVWGQTTLAYQY